MVERDISADPRVFEGSSNVSERIGVGRLQSTSSDENSSNEFPEVSASQVRPESQDDCDSDTSHADDSDSGLVFHNMNESSAIGASFVTLENINCLENILKGMKAAYALQQKKRKYLGKHLEVMLPASPKLLPINEKFKTNGPNKVEISRNSGFFLPDGLYETIEKKSLKINKKTGKGERNWRNIIRMCLIEVYGDELPFYCAKGRDGARTGMDTALFKAVWDWAQEFSGQQLEEEVVVKFVNDLTYNKYRVWKNKNTISIASQHPKKKKPKLDNTDHDKGEIAHIKSEDHSITESLSAVHKFFAAHSS